MSTKFLNSPESVSCLKNGCCFCLTLLLLKILFTHFTCSIEEPTSKRGTPKVGDTYPVPLSPCEQAEASFPSQLPVGMETLGSQSPAVYSPGNWHRLCIRVTLILGALAMVRKIITWAEACSLRGSALLVLLGTGGFLTAWLCLIFPMPSTF